MDASANAFDPFNEDVFDDAASDMNTSIQTENFFGGGSPKRGGGGVSVGGGSAFQDASFDASFDVSFDDAPSFRFPATAGAPSSAFSGRGGRARGSAFVVQSKKNMSFSENLFPIGDEAGGSDDELLVRSGGNRNGTLGRTAARRETIVNVTLVEEMTSLYDSISRTSSLSIDGVVSIEAEGSTFNVSLKDSQDQVEELIANTNVLKETTSKAKRQEGDSRFFRLSMPESPDEHPLEILKYSCSDALRPVPLLVQSKVRMAGKFCRVGIKIRANPSNTDPLVNLAILLAVPPDINGETVKMSRRGGLWDSMKRIIAWPVEELKSGAHVEVQAQFESLVPPDEDGAMDKVMAAKFPLLVRCDCLDTQLSDVEIGVRHTEGTSSDLKLYLMRSYRIFHRKV